MSENDPSTSRFQFGKNWSRFLRLLNNERIEFATASLQRMLGVSDLKGKRFLDAGSGSGLFSLAAARLGAAEIVSFDYDINSVQCTAQLKERFAPEHNWRVLQGSVLDQQWMFHLGTFDIVYSWGVLHHTGNMWVAFERIANSVAKGGILFISIYNDQGWQSRVWWHIKRYYNRAPRMIRAVMGKVYFGIAALIGFISDIAHRRRVSARYSGSVNRGMNAYTDAIDWIGGFPFEVASCEAVNDFFEKRGFTLRTLKRTSGSGCNEFVFERPHS